MFKYVKLRIDTFWHSLYLCIVDIYKKQQNIFKSKLYFLKQKNCMKTRKNNLGHKAVPMLKDKEYKKPAIEIIEMELEQPILAGSSDLPQIPGSNW